MDYDLIIIGSGWAGFNAALTAKGYGLRVALMEKKKVGGTCLNSGCIPTKALIQSAKLFSLISKAKQFGIETAGARIDFLQIQARKEKIIQELGRGMEFMLKGVDFIQAEARFTGPHSIQAGSSEFRAKNFLLATGSRPFNLKGLEFDAKRILTSDEVLNLKTAPSKLLIVGGGVIGCEFASFFNALGVGVHLAEKMPQLLPAEDPQIAKKLENIFKKKGIQVSLGQDAAVLNIQEYDRVLVCVGRVPDFSGLGLEILGINLEKGRIAVDEYLRTSCQHIYAAGDCTARLMLAHYAAYQGNIAAQNIAHPESLIKADNQSVPSCIFTDPEIASVGLNEEVAKAKGIDIVVKKFDFLGSGMARIMGEADGFLKLVFEEQTGILLGACLVGPRATELIAVLTLAVTQKLKSTQIKNTIFAHPTLSEVIPEALK